MTTMTTETTVEATPMDSVDINLNATKQPERTFIGEIVIDAIEPAKVYNEQSSGVQWHFGVKPLNFNLRSETGAFHSWPAIKYSDKTGDLVKTGEFGRTTTALREVFKQELTKRGMELRKQAVAAAQLEGLDTTELARQDPLDFVKVGRGHFLGLQGVFAMRKLEYGTNKKTGETISGGRESIIAVRLVKPEELAQAEASVSGGSTQPDLTYTQEQVDQLLEVMAGKTPSEYMKGIGRRGLPADVVNAVTSGRGLEYLQANNLATVDADGTVRRS